MKTYIRTMVTILTVVLASLLGTIGFTATTASPANALAAVDSDSSAMVNEGEEPPDGTQVIESFDRTYTVYGTYSTTACQLRVVGQDYGNYVVLRAIYMRGIDRTFNNDKYVNLGLTVRNSVGTIIKNSYWPLRLESTWVSTGAPAGSIGDGGQVRMTGAWPNSTLSCSVLVYTANM